MSNITAEQKDDVTVDEMLGLAQWLERISVREVIKDVARVANRFPKDSTSPLWSGYSLACEEILLRLAKLWGRSDDPEWKLP